ncbi:MAG: hypothetical protein RQ993_02115 [Bacteroidota bacterium]|nr:hypothetical protein [Bacteroidota bacterium]
MRLIGIGSSHGPSASEGEKIPQRTPACEKIDGKSACLEKYHAYDDYLQGRLAD